MAYRRKFSKYSRKSKRGYGKRKFRSSRLYRKRLIRTIKAVTKRTAEPKQKNCDLTKVEMYHNTVHTWFLNKPDVNALMPGQGVQENQRIGDQICTKGFSLRMLIGQKADRPNVTFKYWVMKVPKGSTYSYANWFQAVTNNVLLDNPNTDFVKVLQSGTWRPNEAGLSGTGGDEYTFAKKLWIPYKRTLKFGPADAAVTHNDDDLYFLMAAYDAYGTLVTDNIAYVATIGTLYYSDP